ncbi:MAG: phenylacetic acid degradation bifunctional protein PaaZ [Aestuariivita sp.]|nr:phenylacetic acid degradation bifunctional protein PaaZ [Aestuariivita sp.]
MSILDVKSYVAGQWIPPNSSARDIENPVTGQVMAQAGNDTIKTEDMLSYARTKGAPALQAISFHDRARLLKSLAIALNNCKEDLYNISFLTGATLSDHRYDIDGGIGTLFVFASKGRRELPNDVVYLDGPIEHLSKTGKFLGQHVCTSLQGVALQINAFNFPVWGMLEKLAPAFLAGMPVIVKPATATSYVTELAVKIMLETGFLPDGSLQLISGGLGDTISQLTCQDVVSFTGSADTASELKASPHLHYESIRFIAEQDSLNATILGPDITANHNEFSNLTSEVIRELTTKAGQKCTAIRRILVPDEQVDEVISALCSKLKNIIVGHPKNKSTRMGSLVSNVQKQAVIKGTKVIGKEAECIFGDIDAFDVIDADSKLGAFVPPMLYYCDCPDTAEAIHVIEVFGPVATIMGYRDLDHAIDLANRGGGSLVASIFTRSSDVARQIVLGSGAYHGRLYFSDYRSAEEATGHGSPLPHMLHGGPGRAGGGEELGGIRGVMRYMQRTAIQGGPDVISAIGNKWVPGAAENTYNEHPFKRYFDFLKIGETIRTQSRTVTIKDIEKFAHFTGDTFYAHMDDEAARRNPFFPCRVAHGYLLLSFAAGLFVEPNEGPVLANTGLDHLRFTQPIVAGDQIKVRLTVMQKTPRNTEYGEVRWHVTVTNQKNETVAEYELLTMNSFSSKS